MMKILVGNACSFKEALLALTAFANGIRLCSQTWTTMVEPSFSIQ
jgi:hypothetical protein